MNKNFIFIVLLISTLFLLLQHYNYLSWDYMVYLMNSEFFLGKESYFEWGRPPLTPFLMIFGEYSFLIISSLCVFFGILKFSKKYEINPLIFYLLILSPFTLITGALDGTELLSLGILLLFFAYFEKSISGFLMSLLCLNHYRNLSYLIFIFLKKEKIVKSIIFFILTLTPWLLFNYFIKNDLLFSFADQYALNIFFRNNSLQMPKIEDVLISSSFLIPFALLGLKKIGIKKLKKIDFFMIFFYAINLFSYFFTPFKFVRYLYLSIIPIAYFSAKFFESLNLKLSYTVLFIYFFAGVFIYFFNGGILKIEKYPSESLMNSLELVNDSCMILSNDWVILNYVGILSGPAPRQELIDYYLSHGYFLLMFKGYNDFDYVKNNSFMSSLPIIYENNYYYLIGKNDVCLAPFYYNIPFSEEINQTLFLLYNETFKLSLIDMIFKRI